jgi:DNA-binding CsgD family transcriptional regulator
MAACLTPSQHEVARLYAAGLRRAEIARRLGLRIRTVDAHMTATRQRLGTRSRRAMATSLAEVEVARLRGGVPSAQGYEPGDAVWVVGGRYAGRAGVYVRRANALQLYVRIGGGIVAPKRENVRRVVDALDTGGAA